MTSLGISLIIPVYNEAKHLKGVLREVRRTSPEILVVNDGSIDGTADGGISIVGSGMIDTALMAVK